tara:strand:+ start:926 stop:1645 length:720 start_codon:yes stop_codon:yes gene_type:complete
MITELEKKILGSEILSPQDWIDNIETCGLFVGREDEVARNRVEVCFLALKKDWEDLLVERNIVIPASDYEFAELVFAQPDYKSSAQKEADLLPSDAELLQNAKDKKMAETKSLRKFNINKPTPQTITYEGNLLGKMFSVNFDKDVSAITGIINALQILINASYINPTRGWTDVNNKRWELDIEDFRSLLVHILERDDQERKQEELKNNLIIAILPIEDEKTIQETIAEVEAFNINQIII